MLGYIIYNREDYNINSNYVDWIKNIGKKNGLDIRLEFSEEFYKNGVNLDGVDFVINRSRSYNISLTLELNNIRTFNNSTITLLGNNKLAAYKYAKDMDVKYPSILSYWGVDRESIISKPVDGHGGHGVELVSDVSFQGDSFRLQQIFMDNLIGDVRFYIINNQIKHGVLRTSKDSIKSNFSQGGSIELFNYNNDHINLINRILKGIHGDYIGLDFLVTKDGKLLFNEIEDVVGSRMLSKLGINNTTELFIKHIVDELS